MLDRLCCDCVECGDVGLVGVVGVADVAAVPGCAMGVRVETGGRLVRNVGIVESGFRKTLFGMSGGSVEIIPTIAAIFHCGGTVQSMPVLEAYTDEWKDLLIDDDRPAGSKSHGEISVRHENGKTKSLKWQVCWLFGRINAFESRGWRPGPFRY